MGREWLNEIKLDWQKLNLAASDTSDSVVSTNNDIEGLLQKYEAVFKEGHGVMNTFEARLQVKEGAKPKFCKARPVPFALKGAIDRELDCLEADGILEKVTYSEWAAPVVPVPKTEGQLQLCGDYKVTINPVLEVDQYLLPKPDNIFATLATGKFFTKIDLTHAYQQMAEGRFQRLRHNQYSSWAVSIYSTAIWRDLCTFHFPESHGHSAAVSSKDHMFPG